jgi:hypothetical protein
MWQYIILFSKQIWGRREGLNCVNWSMDDFDFESGLFQGDDLDLEGYFLQSYERWNYFAA